jgi:trehalose 6-phosphate phosphatase
MQHLFHAWPEFTAAAAAAEHILLLADYDGTLAAIVGRPEEAVLSAGVRQKLRELAAKPDCSVGVISGRSFDDIKALVGIRDIYYSGNHGLEIEGPGLKYLHPEAAAARAVVTELAAPLAAALADVSGVIIQDKGFSLSVHYRLAPDKEDIVAATVARITEPYVARGKVQVYPMKKLWEIRPPIDWNKGRAVALIGRLIRETLKISRLLTVYLGDDTTDEDAFRVLRRPEGWSIFIGGEKTSSSAEYCLGSVPEVEEFLGRLVALK